MAALTVLVAVLWMAWNAGGYFPVGFLGPGALVCAVLGLLLLARPPYYLLSVHALVGLGCLAGLAIWTGISTRWSPSPDTGLEYMQRDLVYAAIFGLAILAAGSGRLAAALVWGVLGTTSVIVGAGLVSRLFPDLIPSYLVGLGGYRLAYPLGYWNAYGSLASFGIVLALGLAADPRSRVALRCVSGAATVVMACAMYLSFSRGAWLALFAGLLLLALVAPHRWSLLVTAAVIAPAVIVAIGRLDSYAALTKNPRLDGGVRAAGEAFAVELLVLVALVAFLIWLVSTARRSQAIMSVVRRRIRPASLMLAAGAIVFVAGLYVVKSAAIEGRAAAWSTSANGWLSRQWADFLRPATPPSLTLTRERLTTTRGTRADLYRVAIDGFEAHPIRGDGAGAFGVRWAQERRVDEDVRNAHSLLLETLSELGAVGGLLLVGFFGSMGVALIRSRTRPGGLGRSQAAAVGAACVVWLVESTVDWEWQMPGFTAMALILAASLYPYGRRVRRRELAPSARPPARERALPS